VTKEIDNLQDDPQRERFTRWQKITIDQFGYTLNLTLTFTIAALAYWFELLRDAAFIPGPAARRWMCLALFALSLSALAGFGCALNRLQDFRGSTKRAGGKPDAPTRAHLRCRGRISWLLLYTQLSGFATGIAALAITLLLTCGAKLA